MGKLYVVATPIGNLNDITKRAIDTLKEVDIILCEDTRHSLKLLNYYKIKNRLLAYHKFNESKITSSIIEKLKTQNIALITDAGTPCISDPGYILIKEARLNNIEVIGIGGISAFTTALSICGLNTNSFSFYGFFPRQNKDKKNLINKIKKGATNLHVIYESPKRIIDTLKYIYSELGNVSISVSSDLTKIHEKNYYGFLNNVIIELESNENSDLGEYTIVFEYKILDDENVEKVTIESMLIDIVLKKKVSLKEAVKILKDSSNIPKSDIYDASINLKNMNL